MGKVDDEIAVVGGDCLLEDNAADLLPLLDGDTFEKAPA